MDKERLCDAIERLSMIHDSIMIMASSELLQAAERNAIEMHQILIADIIDLLTRII